MRHSPPP
ncbi:hypothetical protein, partial [Achromobacter phage kwar_LB4]